VDNVGGGRGKGATGRSTALKCRTASFPQALVLKFIKARETKMIRKPIQLGLVLGAISMATTLSMASALAAEFHSAKSPTFITGRQSASHVFNTNAGTVTCTSVGFTGVDSVNTSATLAVTPTYQNCTAFGFIGITVDPNGCFFEMNSNGSSKILCPAGKALEITVPFCTTSVGPQTFPTGLVFGTVGTTPSRHIILETFVANITYNECGTVRKNGSYTGTTNFTGSAGEIWYL
jgi:hypothetical protein